MHEANLVHGTCAQFGGNHMRRKEGCADESGYDCLRIHVINIYVRRTRGLYAIMDMKVRFVRRGLFLTATLWN
jgi:hypothetical protein